MPGRKIRDESDAHRCLRSLEESGLTVAEWARTHAVDGRSLTAWRHNLGMRRRSLAVEAAPAQLVEWVASTPMGESPMSEPSRCDRSSARYVVRLGGVEIEVGDDFRGDTLARLLDVIGC